jgi:hypothetical protein
MLSKCLGDEIIKCLGCETKALDIRQLPEADFRCLEWNSSQASAYWGISEKKTQAVERAIALPNFTQLSLSLEITH